MGGKAGNRFRVGGNGRPIPSPLNRTARPELIATPNRPQSSAQHLVKSQRPGKFIPGLGLTPPPPNPVKGQAR